MSIGASVRKNWCGDSVNRMTFRWDEVQLWPRFPLKKWEQPSWKLRKTDHHVPGTGRHLCVYSSGRTRWKGGMIWSDERAGWWRLKQSPAPRDPACKTSKPDPPYLRIPGLYILMIPLATGPSVPHAAPVWPISAWPETQTLQWFLQRIRSDQHFISLAVFTQGQFCLPGDIGSTGDNFLLPPWEEGCWWHLVGKAQGCCRAQDSLCDKELSCPKCQ